MFVSGRPLPSQEMRFARRVTFILHIKRQTMKPGISQYCSTSRRRSEQAVGMRTAPRQSTDKGELEELKLHIEIVRLVCVSLGVSVGMLSLFFYCFFAAKFIPSGVTAGDTLLFIFLSLAIGFIGLLTSGIGSLIWMPFVTPAKELSESSGNSPELKSQRKWLMYVSGLYFLIAAVAGAQIFNAGRPEHEQSSWLLSDLSEQSIGLLFVSVAASSAAVALVRKVSAWEAIAYSVGPASAVLLGAILAPLPNGNAIIHSAMWGGMLLAIAFGKPTDFRELKDAKQPRSSPANGTAVESRGSILRRRVVICACAALLPPLLISMYGAENSKVGMPYLVFGPFGIFSYDAAVAVSADNLQTLTAAAELTGEQLQMCRGPHGTAIVTGIKVWWHGLGVRSLVEIPSARLGEGQVSGARVELETSGMKLIRDYGTHCIEVPDFAFFESGEGKRMSGDGLQALESALKSAMTPSQADRKLVAIEVIGHADPMPSANSTTNEALGKTRAEEVARQLSDIPSLKAFFAAHAKDLNKVLTVVTFGSRRPAQTCKVEGSVAAQRECNSVNRRVEIKLRFATEKAEKVSAGASRTG